MLQYCSGFSSLCDVQNLYTTHVACCQWQLSLVASICSKLNPLMGSEGRKKSGKVNAKLKRSTFFLLLLIYAIVLLKNAGLSGPAAGQMYTPVHCISTSLKQNPSMGLSDLIRPKILWFWVRVPGQKHDTPPNGQEWMSKAAQQDFVQHLYLCFLTLSFSWNKSHNNKSELRILYTGDKLLNRKCTAITTKVKAEFHTEVVKIFDIDISLTNVLVF